jgi:hypothetical protein
MFLYTTFTISGSFLRGKNNLSCSKIADLIFHMSMNETNFTLKVVKDINYKEKAVVSYFIP